MKKPIVKPEKAWCVWHPDVGFFFHTTRNTRRACIDYWMMDGVSWREDHKAGYRCVPVEIRKRKVRK